MSKCILYLVGSWIFIATITFTEPIPEAKPLILASKAPIAGAANNDLQQSSTDILQTIMLERRAIDNLQQLIDIQTKQLQQKQLQENNKTLQWLAAKPGYIPKNAFIVTRMGSNPIYVCHANYVLGGLHPGQVVSAGCLIPYGGKTVVETSYEVLALRDISSKETLQWKDTEELQPYLSMGNNYNIYPISNPAKKPVEGGFENGHPLYICRAMYGDAVYVGKVFGDGKYCNIPVKDTEVLAQAYQVLFVDNSNTNQTGSTIPEYIPLIKSPGSFSGAGAKVFPAR